MDGFDSNKAIQDVMSLLHIAQCATGLLLDIHIKEEFAEPLTLEMLL